MATGKQSILYALISRGKTVLAEYTDQAGNFPTVTRMLLGKIDDTKPGRVSYVYDQYMFHYTVVNSIIFLCMTDADKNGQDRVRLPYAFIEEIKDEFLKNYGERAQSAIAFEMNNEFGPFLEGRMKHYNTAADRGGTITAVQGKLEAVKGVMVQNIEQILERGEKLELLVDKTDQLQTQAFQFQKTSRRLKNAMFMRKLKLYALITCVAIFLAWVISAAACGIAYERCRDDNKSKSDNNKSSNNARDDTPDYDDGSDGS